MEHILQERRLLIAEVSEVLIAPEEMRNRSMRVRWCSISGHCVGAPVWVSKTPLCVTHEALNKALNKWCFLAVRLGASVSSFWARSVDLSLLRILF